MPCLVLHATSRLGQPLPRQLLIASTVIAVGATTGDMATYSAYAAALVLVIGVVFLVSGIARLGWVTQFLSKPVMDGFIVGLAIFVAVGQLNKLFGVEKGEGNTFQKLFAIIKQLPEANWVTFAVGAGALALLFLMPRWNKKIPSGLLVLFGSIIISVVFQLNTNVWCGCCRGTTAGTAFRRDT